MTTLAIFAVVCVTLLAGLVLVLRHLAAMRVTNGEAAALGQRIEALGALLGPVNEKINLLNNRLQR